MPRCCTTRSRTRAPSLEDVAKRFGEEVAQLVDGVTKLAGITFQSRDEQQAENYRKMMVAMASDIRVILIKLADRLHNMRTLERDAEAEAAREGQGDARDLRAAGAPARHPRDQVGARGPRLRHAPPAQVQRDQVARQPAARPSARATSSAPAATCRRSSRPSASSAEISGRAKHFYSIYSKMTKKGREFNEIYDLTAMRVIVDSVKDCYGAIGVIHSLWKPLPGRFKDFVAMPKFNMYQALHTTVIGPEGRPLEIQIRTREMHEHRRVRHRRALALQGRGGRRARARWRPTATAARQATGCGTCSTGRRTVGPAGVRRHPQDRPVRGRGLRLHAEGRGQVAAGRRDAARLRLRDPHRRRPPLRRREGQRQDRAAALRAAVGRHLRGPDLEEGARPVARLARRLPRPRARSRRSAPGSSASAARTPSARGRDILHENLRSAGPAAAEDRRLAAARRRDPRDGLQEGRRLLHRARPGEDLAEGRRQQGHAAAQAGRGGAVEPSPAPTALLDAARRPAPQDRRRRPTTASASRASTT